MRFPSENSETLKHGNEGDPRFQRVAHLARQIKGLSEPTRTTILHLVEFNKRQAPARNQAARVDERRATSTQVSESNGSNFGHRCVSDRLKRIEQQLNAVSKTYRALNKFTAHGATSGPADADGETML
ncbi:MAG: hypothetical protein J5J06_15460 [Phycisphaerae bacterium]|nr:hypothetical protein [Phycisphaerae bacterium]